MTPRRFLLAFAVATLGLGVGLRRTSDAWFHWLMVYPLAAVGLAVLFAVGFLFADEAAALGCGQCGKKGRHHWPVCRECAADRHDVEEVGKV